MHYLLDFGNSIYPHPTTGVQRSVWSLIIPYYMHSDMFPSSDGLYIWVMLTNKSLFSILLQSEKCSCIITLIALGCCMVGQGGVRNALQVANCSCTPVLCFIWFYTGIDSKHGTNFICVQNPSKCFLRQCYFYRKTIDIGSQMREALELIIISNAYVLRVLIDI